MSDDTKRREAARWLAERIGTMAGRPPDDQLSGFVRSLETQLLTLAGIGDEPQHDADAPAGECPACIAREADQPKWPTREQIREATENAVESAWIIPDDAISAICSLFEPWRPK